MITACSCWNTIVWAVAAGIISVEGRGNDVEGTDWSAGLEVFERFDRSLSVSLLSL
jgi:hypothetical protein